VNSVVIEINLRKLFLQFRTRPVTTYFSDIFKFENLSCEVWDASNSRVCLIKEKVRIYICPVRNEV